jgi:23S rRNA (pseudouridine1915-N3)-methyltransferase
LLNVRIIVVGKDKAAWVTDGCAHFEKLLSRFARTEWISVAAEKGGTLSPGEIRKAEAARLLARLERGLVVALDPRGDSPTSEQLACCLDKWIARSTGLIQFVIGGPYGLDRSVIDRADEVLSLSKLTLSHQVVRLVLMEQLFRVFSIRHGTDYHK